MQKYIRYNLIQVDLDKQLYKIHKVIDKNLFLIPNEKQNKNNNESYSV